jgi:phenylpropionate dioxygenase-like ring-hydroxylating dioxygenase large terminal subunit
MTAEIVSQPIYNGLTNVKATLPSGYYFDPEHYQRELDAIWYRNWVYVCRADALAEPRAFYTFRIATQQILLARDEGGQLRAFYNTCRHRGSTLCTEAAGRLRSKFIVCPYHGWAYDLSGRLAVTPFVGEGSGFARENYPLYNVAVAEWRGFVFIHLGKDVPPLPELFGPVASRLDNWPLETLGVGHTYERILACNWKVFWENFKECLHCPGVHPELSDLVPVYKRAFMAERDDPHWQEHADSDDPKYKGGLRRDAATWSRNGKADGAIFPALTETERRFGQAFVTGQPSLFMVGHVNYVRVVRLLPLGPETTELRAQWLFPAETLADKNFDMGNVVEFAKLVMDQDALACEFNQRGLRSRAHQAGILMPQEYAVHQFHQWVRQALACS